MTARSEHGLTPSELALLLRYDRESGRLVWLPRKGRGRVPVEQHPGRRDRGGYWRIRIREKALAEHRVVWALCVGEWPKEDIDHIDGNRKNNRIENLRDVDRTANCRNSALDPRNKVGCPDVKEYRPGKWIARISTDAGRLYLGSFDSCEAAIEVRKRAEREAGYHPNHGRLPLEASA